MNKQEAIEVIKMIQNLIDNADASIILNNFLKSFNTKSIDKAGTNYLHGSFNITGTRSARMSSNSPNMQNIPSTGTKYAKIIKDCFVATKGWVMLGADFSSLEAKIAALITRDPNRLRVYTDGYDSHAAASFAYYRDQIPDIVDTVESINSIAIKYPKLRQDSKAISFCLQYAGTKHALMNQCGLSPENAERIENAYHKLYKVSDQWVADKLLQASVDGYITGAFGLRLRTPILRQVLLNKRSTPYAAKAESRTAGNMLGQSYGTLNNRACIAFMDQVHRSKYKYDILPIAQIHDASYYLVKDQIGIVKWVNDHLIAEMEWQDDPAIQDDTVKLGGNLELYYGSWAKPISIENNSSKESILAQVQQTIKDKEW